MEQNFQTSFIPKKQIIEDAPKISQSFGLFTIFSIVIFFGMVLSFGGFYFYGDILKKDIIEKEDTLKKAKNRFELVKIQELQVLDKRLDASSKILSSHISVYPLFKMLNENTMKTIRYTDFNYGINALDSSKVLIKLSGQTLGYAMGYKSIALQADIFSKNKNIIDPIFSNLSLDAKGNVLFDLEFFVEMKFINYEQNLLSNE